MRRKLSEVIRYPADASILDIRQSDFQTIRCGDMIAVINVIEHLRRRDDRPDLQFHLLGNAMHHPPYVRQFHDFLAGVTDYLSTEASGQHISGGRISVWDYRCEVGDQVTIRNPYETTRKVAIFPLLDARYNQYRNWPSDVFAEILDQYRDYDGERVICMANRMMAGADAPPLIFPGYTLSHDFADNLYHALSAEVFVGGDTGFSHLVGSLDRGPCPIYYYHGTESEIRSLPLGYQRRGRIVTF